MSKHKLTWRYLTSNMSIAIGLVLIWRGIWYVLDGIDKLFFSGSPIITALGGIVVGLAILYWPDHDLKELQKL
jgi:hypothetical protein